MNKYQKPSESPFNRGKRGQALITLLFFAVIAMIISSAAVVIIVANTQSTSQEEEGTIAYYVAESGAENGVLRLLRNPNYTGETLAVGNYYATISATTTGTNAYVATSSANVNNFVRKIQVVLSYTNNIFTVSSWKEIQ